MPDHDSASLLSRQTKRRRVDIGVKRTVGSVILAQARETLLNAMNQSHGAEQDGDCSLVPHGHRGTNGEGEKSNVLRKLLKRANSYEDALMPFPGATIISQLLKSNMGKSGGSEGGFQGSGGLSSTGSEIQAEDACSSSSRDRDSPQECLSPGPPPFGRPPPPTHPSLSSFDLERLSDEHLRAKRARVENIIRGMSHSPCVAPPRPGDRDREAEREEEGRERERERRERERPPLQQPPSPPGSRGGEGYRENKRKQRLPQQQHSFTQLVCARQEQRLEERRQLKLQLEDMQKQLRQLQEKFYQIYDSETEEEEIGEPDHGGRDEDGNLSEDSVRSDGLEERHRDHVAGAASAVHGRRGNGRNPDDLSELDPGLFLDRARALLREQALLDGDVEEGREDEEDEEEEEEEREGGRMKRDGGRRGERGGRGSVHTQGRQLAETLKQELNSAMSQVVDTVVKGFSSPKAPPGLHHRPPPTPVPQAFPPLSSLPPDPRYGGLNMGLHSDSPNYHAANQRLQCYGDVIIPSPLDSFGGLSGPPPNDQTEALPLVVRKSVGEHASPSLPPPHPHHPSLHPSPLSASLGFSPPSFRHPFPLPLMGYPFQSPLGPHGGGFSVGGKDPRSSPESLDLSRETMNLRTKMAVGGGGHLGAHHLRHSSPSQQGGLGAEGLSLSLIKSECGDLQDMADISPYSGSTVSLLGPW